MYVGVSVAPSMKKQFKDRHHKPRTRRGMRILINRINDVFEINDRWTEVALAAKITGDHPHLNPARVTTMVHALVESES
jgi:hypothetical protein